MAIDPVRDLRTLHAFYDTIDQLIASHDPALALAVPASSGWSSEQHLAHVALANELVLRNLKSLVQGSGALVVRGSASNPQALALLEQGRLPRGQAQAPRMVRPPERVVRELLLQWLSEGRAELALLLPESLRANDLAVPHQLLGPLDAPHWARFAVVHTHHHLGIVLEILAALRPTLALPALAEP